ncbi:MAG: nitronate monooxygenase [Desulfobacterales bacterium]|nr:nitronate monooxygenase [Desulfobacterales bacterium]
MKNRITEILGVDYPIISGPMRLMTLGEMAGHFSETGGFGQIAASGLSSDRMRAEVQRARELTRKPVGINIPLYRPNAREAIEIAIEFGLKTITTSAGDPSKFIERIKEGGLKVLHKVSSVEMALKAERAGVDGVIAMGFEAGGHLGREGITTMCLVPQLVDALKVPVVAAGGIADARGLLAAFALGAEGVEMGTRLVATRQCPAPAFFKESLIAAKCDSTILLGKEAMPVRMLRNKASMMISNKDKTQEDRTLRETGDRNYVMQAADGDSALMPCGQIGGLITEVRNVAELIPELLKEARLLSSKLYSYLQEEGNELGTCATGQAK